MIGDSYRKVRMGFFSALSVSSKKLAVLFEFENAIKQTSIYNNIIIIFLNLYTIYLFFTFKIDCQPT